MQSLGKAGSVALALAVGLAVAVVLDRGRSVRPDGHKEVAPVEDRQPVHRPPDNGPRADARTEMQEFAGMRVQIMRVWIEQDFHDGINWRQTSKPMLKV